MHGPISMEAIVARRFAPLNFSDIPGFPNSVPTMDVWGDCLPRFRENKEDNPSDHLIKFHQCMVQLNIQHEDVLMKMFMYSLEKDARDWYFSLPAVNISSLKEFHTCFRKRCKYLYPAELFLKDCCEQADVYHTISDLKNYDDEYSQEFKTCHKEVEVSEFVEDEKVTFLDIAVKEECYDHCDNQVVVLGQFEDCPSDEISRDSLELSHNDFNNLNNSLNANPFEDQSLVQQTFENQCCVKDQFCIEGKDEPLASSLEISQNTPCYDEEIRVPRQAFCGELDSIPLGFDTKFDEGQAVHISSEVVHIHGYDKSAVQNHYEDGLIFNKYDDEIEKKDPEICEVCDKLQSDQQIQECSQSIIFEQQKPLPNSHSFEDSVEKEVQSVDIVDDTIQNFTEQIQADPDVFYHQCLIDIHGTKYSYGQPEQEEVTHGNFYDPIADYLESIPSYKSVISETLFDESGYKLLNLCSSCFPIFLIIYIFGVGNKFWWVDQILSWLHWKWDFDLIQ